MEERYNGGLFILGWILGDDVLDTLRIGWSKGKWDAEIIIPSIAVLGDERGRRGLRVQQIACQKTIVSF